MDDNLNQLLEIRWLSVYRTIYMYITAWFSIGCCKAKTKICGPIRWLSQWVHACRLIPFDLKEKLVQHLSRKWLTGPNCRRFKKKMQTVSSFFQLYVILLGIYRWLEIYRWLVTFGECSLAHWNLIRHFEKHETWRTVKRNITNCFLGKRNVPQPFRCTSLWAKI